MTVPKRPPLCYAADPEMDPDVLGRIMVDEYDARPHVLVDDDGEITEGQEVVVDHNTPDEIGVIAFGERWPEVKAAMARRADYTDGAVPVVTVTRVTPQ